MCRFSNRDRCTLTFVYELSQVESWPSLARSGLSLRRNELWIWRRPSVFEAVRGSYKLARRARASFRGRPARSSLQVNSSSSVPCSSYNCSFRSASFSWATPTRITKSCQALRSSGVVARVRSSLCTRLPLAARPGRLPGARDTAEQGCPGPRDRATSLPDPCGATPRPCVVPPVPCLPLVFQGPALPRRLPCLPWPL